VKNTVAIYNDIYKILGEYISTYIPSRTSGRGGVTLSFRLCQQAIGGDIIAAKLPSRYHRVPRYFFTVIIVAQNWWYRHHPGRPTAQQ